MIQVQCWHVGKCKMCAKCALIHLYLCACVSLEMCHLVETENFKAVAIAPIHRHIKLHRHTKTSSWRSFRFRFVDTLIRPSSHTHTQHHRRHSFQWSLSHQQCLCFFLSLLYIWLSMTVYVCVCYVKLYFSQLV